MKYNLARHQQDQDILIWRHTMTNMMKQVKVDKTVADIDRKRNAEKYILHHS